MKSAHCIYGMGYFVPKKVYTNDDLSKFIDTNNEWIQTRTGIAERHLIDEGTPCEELALKAAHNALADANIKAEEITHIVAASCSADFRCPPFSSLVSYGLGLRGVVSFDVNTVCSGFLSSLDICRGVLSVNPKAKILLVASESLTRFCDWSDRTTAVLFGDGAGAVVLANADQASDSFKIKAYLHDTLMSSDGEGTRYLRFGLAGSSFSKKKAEDSLGSDYFIQMNGREIFKYAVRSMTQSCQDLLQKHKLSIDDIALLIPHQANVRILEAVQERLAISPERVMVNLQKYGNTSAASVPIALCEAVAAQKIHSNDKVLLTAFGGGFVWGSALLEFV